MTCATYVDGVWSTGETDFDGGEVSNLDCALVAVTVDGSPYWITSRSFDGKIGGDPDIRHSFSTAEAMISVGTDVIGLTDADFNPVFGGNVETLTLTGSSVEIRIE